MVNNHSYTHIELFLGIKGCITLGCVLFTYSNLELSYGFYYSSGFYIGFLSSFMSITISIFLLIDAVRCKNLEKEGNLTQTILIRLFIDNRKWIKFQTKNISILYIVSKFVVYNRGLCFFFFGGLAFHQIIVFYFGYADYYWLWRLFTKKQIFKTIYIFICNGRDCNYWYSDKLYKSCRFGIYQQVFQ